MSRSEEPEMLIATLSGYVGTRSPNKALAGYVVSVNRAVMLDMELALTCYWALLGLPAFIALDAPHKVIHDIDHNVIVTVDAGKDALSQTRMQVFMASSEEVIIGLDRVQADYDANNHAPVGMLRGTN